MIEPLEIKKTSGNIICIRNKINEIIESVNAMELNYIDRHNAKVTNIGLRTPDSICPSTHGTDYSTELPSLEKI